MSVGRSPASTASAWRKPTSCHSFSPWLILLSCSASRVHSILLGSAIRARCSPPRSPASKSGPSRTGRTRSKKRASPSASSAGASQLSVSDALLDKLRAAVGAANVLTGIELSPYVVEGRTPEAAVFPGSVDEMAAVIGLAAEAARPVTPWGGGTAARGGMPAAAGGLVLGLGRV